MLYFKNVELAEKYHISLGTVRNWIEAAQNGKLDIALHTKDSKSYVANTASNIAAIEQLVKGRRKYRNTKAVKMVTPRSEFYKLYNQEQIYDIVTNLEMHREIPRQYNYFDGGADHWDAFTQRLAAEETPNVLTSTLKLLEKNQGYIDGLLAGYKRVNVVDIGVGNALPVRDLLARLLEQGVLGRYIAIDISAEMLEIARRNLKEWFGDKVAFEGHKLDINYDRFATLLANEYIKKDANNTANLILLLGGTLCNMRAPDGAFKIIHDSMGINDFLIHTQKLDSPETRRHFDFNVDPGSSAPAPIHGLVVDLLNIDKSLYRLELGYDEQRHERYERLRFKVALTIKFSFDGGERVIDFNKGDAILIWRSWQQLALEVINQFDRNDFYLLQTSQTEDQEYILTVSRVKRD